MKKAVKLIFIFSVFLFVGSCAVGPDFKRPEYQANDKYRSSEARDSSLNLSWWDFYNDEVLDSLIIKALNNNKDMLMAAARIEQSKASLGYTKADQVPTFNIRAGVNYGNYSSGILLPGGTGGGFAITPELIWEIDFWGKFRRSTEAARAELVSSIYGMRSIQIGIISEVAKNYFLLLDNKQRLLISHETFRSRDSSQQIVQARFDRGYVAEIDLNQAQIQSAISESAIPVYERQIALLENNLSILIGENPDSILTDASLFDNLIVDTIPSGIPSLLLRRRPDILQAEADLHQQVAKVGVAQAMRFPSISLSGAVGIASNSLISFNAAQFAWGIGASLFGPLFQFQKNKRRMEVEKYKAEEVAYRYEKTVLNAFKEVEDNLISIEKLKKELVARKKQMLAAKNAEMLSYERYNKGVTSYLEVLQSQKYSFEAQLEYSRNYQEILSYYILLYKSLGGGWLSPEEMDFAKKDDKLFEEYIIPYQDLPKKERKQAEKEARQQTKAEKKKK